MTCATEGLTQRLCISIGQHITTIWQSQFSLKTSPALLTTSPAYLLLSARRVCSASLSVLNTADAPASRLLCSQSSSIVAKNHASWHSMHTKSEDGIQHVPLPQELIKCPWHAASPQQPPRNSQGVLLLGRQHAKQQTHHAMSTGTPRGRKNRQHKVETGDAATDDAIALIPKEVTQRAKQLGKLMTQQRQKRSRDKLETKYSAQIRRKLKTRFHTVVGEAASGAHWKANPTGFLACLQDIELLFRQLFAPLRSESPPDYCCSVMATSASVSQCIDCILPVLLTQQGEARNMVGVAEFLQDMMGMDGSQIFRCFVQEPSVLYLDVYNSLLPVQDFFHKLHWDPAAYNQIISRHPQILLLPLQQFQRSIGYLLGQGLTQAEILSMWGQRAGLLVEPLDRLHGEVLALRASDRPLQDLALPFHQRAILASKADSRSFVPRGDLPQPPARTGKLEAAISALVGTPQAVYLYQQTRNRLATFRGVCQGMDGQFIAKAPVGKNGAIATLGRFPTVTAAAKAYDAALYEVYGFRRLFNFPEDYLHMKPHSVKDSTNDKQTPRKQMKPSVQLALQQ